MADAYHRATGDVAAATTTYGAGFTNAYTTLAEARFARIPLVLVVGDAPSSGLRPFDIDQAKAAEAAGVVTLVAGPGNAAAITHRAFDLALQTVQPVVLAIPYDLATTPPSAPEPLEPLPVKPAWPADPDDLERVAALLGASERPLILGGRGVLLAQAVEPLRQVGDRLGALFMTSVMAANAFNSPWDLGIAGGFTRSHRLDVARRADLVLVVGASLNIFQTRYGTLFPEGTKVIRVDNEPDPGHPTADYVRADIRPFIEGLLERIPTASSTWRRQVPDISEAEFRSSVPSEDPVEFGPDGRLNPRAVVAALDRILPAERSVVMDAGTSSGGRPMYLSVPDPHAMILVGTAFQSIGLGFGSAAGVSVARPERTTVLVSGDGGGLMGLADFETFLQATRKGVVVVLNDSAYGAELHQYAAKGLHNQAMLIDEVDFAAEPLVGPSDSVTGLSAPHLRTRACRSSTTCGTKPVRLHSCGFGEAMNASACSVPTAGTNCVPPCLPDLSYRCPRDPAVGSWPLRRTPWRNWGRRAGLSRWGHARLGWAPSAPRCGQTKESSPLSASPCPWPG